MKRGLFSLINFSLALSTCLISSKAQAELLPREHYSFLYEAAERTVKISRLEVPLAEQLFSTQTLTRLELATLVNAASAKLAQENHSFTPEENEDLEILSRHLDRELFVLKLEERVRFNQSRLDFLERIGARLRFRAEISFNGEKLEGQIPVTARQLALFGPPPSNTPVALAQQLRLRVESEWNKVFAAIQLKNFGYYGVGRFTSGSVGIPFSTADPPFFEELFVKIGDQHLSATLGRRYFRLGTFGLINDHLFQPLEAVSLVALYKNLSVEAVAASRIDSPDLYEARIGFDFKQMKFGVQGFHSFFTENTKQSFGLNDDRGVSIDSSINFFKDQRIDAEFALYQPKSGDSIHSAYVIGIDLLQLSRLRLNGKYGRISALLPLPTLSLNQAPLDFVDERFIRFRPGQDGFNLTLKLFLPWRFVSELEWINLKDEAHGTARDYILRLSHQTGKNFHFLLEQSYLQEFGFNLHRSRFQFLVKFGA